MNSLKSRAALQQLGQDIRGARLRRNFAIEELAVRADASRSNISCIERGDPGVGIGPLADVLVALGLSARPAELIDIRKDVLGLGLVKERQPQRGRNGATMLRKRKAEPDYADAGHGHKPAHGAVVMSACSAPACGAPG